MNKKLISFLAATAMIVTVSQETMALVGETINDGNIAIEQEMESDDATPEANTTEDTRLSDTNVVEVSTWTDLNAAITNASNGDTIRINGDIDKIGTDKAITITGKTIKIVAQNDDGSGIKITRDSEQSTNGEFIIESGAGLTLEGDLTIEAHDYQNDGMLTHANFIKVENGGNLNITDCKITAHTNDGHNNGKQGNSGLILCEGNMIINDSSAKDSKEVKTRISGYTLEKSGGEELAAVVVKGKDATLTMNGGEISGNYNKYTSPIDGASIQVRDGATFTMEGGSIINNGKIMKDGKLIDNNCIYGSGVYVEGGGSTFIMNGGEISDNVGYNGAGIYIKGKNKENKAILEISKGKINGNELHYVGGADNYGGGIYAEFTQVRIEGNEKEKIEIKNNGVNMEEAIKGGALYCQSSGGGIYLDNSDATIKYVTISGNKTNGNERRFGGAGIRISRSNATIENTDIKGNQAGDNSNQFGGGILIKPKFGGEDKNIILKNVNIKENTVSPNANFNTGDFGRGAGIYIYDANSTLTIEDSDISDNTASIEGGGIFIVDGDVNIKGKTEIYNNKITHDNVGDGKGIAVSDDEKVNIEGDTLINKNNDVYLGENAFIKVVGKLNRVDKNNPISITVDKNNCIIEDEKKATDGKTNGTKLVEYAIDNGENEALTATFEEYFIKSEYMEKDEDTKKLNIGQSQIEKNILTFLDKLPERPKNTPPEITATDKKRFVGDKFDPLKDVTATDAEDGTITLTQNNIKENTVDTSKPGEYKVTYSVTDSVGATTEKTIKVTVKAKSTGGGGGGTIVTPPTKPTDPDRIEGNDRIETSVETSKDLYPNGTNAVVLANAERYTDVLTADPFAIQEKASALLTYKYEIPEKTLKEIQRLGAKKIYISGGYEAVSKKVVDELAAKGYEIFRFDGVDRYDTARKIAIKIREKGNTNTAELASGEDFPDALCMTPLAVKDHAPILLTKKDSIPKYTKQALAEWDIENIKIGGLEKAVSPEVEKQLKSGFEIEKNNKKDSNVYDGAKAVKRIGGEDRYETSAKLAAESYPESKLGVYATGEDFPDALIAGNYAGTKEAPVLLVKGDSLPEPIEKYTKESKIKKATIIGGVNAVSDKVFNLIKAIINR